MCLTGTEGKAPGKQTSAAPHLFVSLALSSSVCGRVFTHSSRWSQHGFGAWGGQKRVSELLKQE